jgi:hypothetical protein
VSGSVGGSFSFFNNFFAKIRNLVDNVTQKSQKSQKFFSTTNLTNLTNIQRKPKKHKKTKKTPFCRHYLLPLFAAILRKIAGAQKLAFPL